MFGSLPCFSHILASRDVGPLRITLLIFLCRSINTLMLSNLMTLPFGLAQWLVKHCPQDQRCLDCEIRVARLTARCGPRRRPPRGDRLVREPDRQRAALSQPGLVVSPVRHLVAGFGNPMAAVSIVFVRHGQA